MKIFRLTRLLSVILVLAMLIQIMPLHSFAASSGSSADEIEAGQPAVTVLGEVEALREEDIKHFRLSDGSFIAVSYGMPVHYEGEDGSWVDIDNTITLNTDTSTYQLNRTDAVVSFANALTNGTVLSTSVGDKSITMSLLDTAQAVMMIAGEEVELMGENPVVETDVDETIPEDTGSETVSINPAEETSPETVPEETVVETIAEEHVEDTTDEIAAAAVTEEPFEADDETGVNEVIEENTATGAETIPQEMAEENNEPVVEEALPTTIPAETLEPTIPEETTTPTVPEETVPEESIPEANDPEATNTDIINTNTEENLTTPGEITFDRNATGEITSEAPTMLTLQDCYSWDIEDVIPVNLQSSLLYEDVFPDVDLLYTAFGNNIKEQIIVNSAQDTYRYDFLLDLDGLTAILNENGSVSFVDAEQTQVYSIPVPYMEDGSGVLSSEVDFILNETDHGLVLTVEANEEWINAEDREFPVKIDPSFTIRSGTALDEIYSAYTMEAAPYDPTFGRQYLYVGAQPYSTTNDGIYRTFMHFHDMPDIPAGSEVVSAKLSLYQQLYNQRYCDSFPVGVYEVTTSLPSAYSSYYNWFASMTWNTNMPAYDTSNAIDYVMVDSNSGYREWNITELVKKWYAEGTDNTTCALVMMNEDEIDTYYYFASTAFLAYASTIPPVLIVSYRSNTGIEPYYTYATLGAASAGTAYVADATGQLKVAKELVSYASSTNPFSLNLIYNSDYFSLASGTDYLPPSKLGLSMNVGSGWTLNYIQKVEAETIDNTNYLKYTDGDGTIHYFIQDSTPDDSNYPYYDEDGLGLKMKVNSTNNYTMADDNGNVWTFTNNYLTSVKDSDGNKININYSSGKISSITQVNKGQSAIELASFTYSSNKLTTVEDAAGNTYTLTYSGTKLASIQKNGTTIASYTYSGYRLTKMTDSESTYALSFTYSNGKISSYKEMGGTTTGVTVAVTYPSHTQTTYRDYGADRTANTSDDILTHYLFDYAGRTANAYTTDKAGNVLGATNAVYSTNTSISKTNNRTLRSASIGIVGQQLLRNTSIESTSNAWTLSGASRASTKPRTGSYSIKGTLSSNGTQYAQKASESLTAGTTYVLSCYVNTASVTSFSGLGVYLKVTDSSGNTWTSYSVNYTTSSAMDGGWVQISVPFTAKVTGAHTIAIYNNGAIGTFYADDFQLETGNAPSSYNLVENGSMQMSSHGWTMGSLASIYTSKGTAGSTASLRIIGEPENSSTNAYQDIGLKLPGTQTYILSGWVYANAIPDDTAADNATDTKRQCGLRAILYYSDSTTESHYISFNSNLSNVWQFTSTNIVPKAPSKTVTKIRVVCAYEGNANVAYFDNISLVRESAQTMTYDANGNLTSVATPGLNADQNTYSGGNLTKTVTGGNGTYTYTYDSTYTHRLKSVSNGQLTQAYGYDGTGNVTSTTLSGTGSATISTSATYGGSSNRLTTVTDATGSTVKYGYSNSNVQMMALPTTVTDPKGTIVTNSYDSYYRLTGMSIANTANLAYNYNKGNLVSIVRTDSGSKSQTYTLAYDAFGNMTSLKVGSKTLASYTYKAGNGQLTKQTYANGATVSYAYDTLGRVKTATYSDGRKLTYYYNGSGTLRSVIETGGSATVTYLYTYDTLGRLINQERRTSTDPVLRVHNIYNTNNQLTKQSWTVGTTTYTQNYTYNSADGSLNTLKPGTGATLTMNYDGLRRLSSVTGGIYGKSYTYRDISSTKTTTQVASLTYDLPTDQTYAYTYDTLGNIATYTAPDGEVITYSYDKQGQLLKAVGDTTYTYTYDTVGNLLTANGHTYTYGNADWKDLLTAYDGETISYDASGNPTSYYNGTRWTFTWNNGRSLTRAVSGSTTVDYTYDLGGLRTGKTVGDVAHKYLYAGDKLMRETYGSNTLDFLYDADGSPYALRYNQTYYYYITNLQGDVMQIVNASGNVAAAYEYDPYGNIVSATGTLAEINPLRYRGYYYDTESGLYYLQSRYYDPTTGRFLNADAFASTGQGFIGYNMFAYCGNNPVCYVDGSGKYPIDPSGDIGGWIGSLLAELIQEELEEDDKKILYQFSTIFTDNIIGIAGFGLGHYAGVSFFEDFFSFAGGCKYDVFSCKYEDGFWYTGQAFYSGLEATILGLFDAGEPEDLFYDSNQHCWKEATPDTYYEFFGAGIYFFAGASYSIGIKIEGFLNDIDALLDNQS